MKPNIKVSEPWVVESVNRVGGSRDPFWIAALGRTDTPASLPIVTASARVDGESLQKEVNRKIAEWERS